MKDFINRNKPVLAISLVTVIIFAVIIALSQNVTVNSPSLKKIENVELIADYSPRKGATEPEVTLIEFSDFECPACMTFNPIVNAIFEKYKDHMRLVYRHFPLPQHPNSKLAAIASQAAQEQGTFWPYADMLFENQEKLDKDSLIKYAENLGMNVEKFKMDLDDPKYSSEVENDLQTAGKIGLNATPSFILNDVLMKFTTLEDFEKQIVQALESEGVDLSIKETDNVTKESTTTKTQPISSDITPSSDVVDIQYTTQGFVPNNLRLKFGQRVRFVNTTNQDMNLLQLIVKYTHISNPMVISANSSYEIVLTEPELWTFKEKSVRHYGSIFVTQE